MKLMDMKTMNAYAKKRGTGYQLPCSEDMPDARITSEWLYEQLEAALKMLPEPARRFAVERCVFVEFSRIASGEAITGIYGAQALIILDARNLKRNGKRRARWTIIHEIAHCWCNHGPYSRLTLPEAEADYVVAELWGIDYVSLNQCGQRLCEHEFEHYEISQSLGERFTDSVLENNKEFHRARWQREMQSLAA
jgi:hypothetical protein